MASEAWQRGAEFTQRVVAPIAVASVAFWLGWAPVGVAVFFGAGIALVIRGTRVVAPEPVRVEGGLALLLQHVDPHVAQNLGQALRQLDEQLHSVRAAVHRDRHGTSSEAPPTPLAEVLTQLEARREALVVCIREAHALAVGGKALAELPDVARSEVWLNHESANFEVKRDLMAARRLPLERR